MAVKTHQAGFVFTDGDGNEVVHRIPATLRFRAGAQYGRVQTRYRTFSLDQQTSETFTIDGGAEECTAMIRFDGDPFGLQELLAAGADGRTLTYRPNLAVNDEYGLELMDYGNVAPASLDSARFSFGEWEAPVRLRLMSGGSLDSLVTDRLAFVTGAGPMRHSTFTRATTSTRINRNRQIESVAAGDRRVTWLERNGVLRPFGLYEAARAQVAANPQAPTSWTNTGSPVVTGSQTDPFGGTTSIQIEDDDGAAQEGKFTGCTFTGDGEKIGVIIAAPGTLSGIVVQIRDTTAGVNRHTVSVTWNAGDTPPTLGTVAGAGALYSPVMIYDTAGRRWWIIPFSATGVVAANTNNLYAIGGLTAAATGTFFLAGGNAFDTTFPPSWFGSAGTRNTDLDVRDHGFVPQESSWIVEFAELADTNFVDAGNTDPRIFHIGNAASTDGAAPRLLVFKSNGAATYASNHATLAGGVSRTVALSPSRLDTVRLFLRLGATGTLQMSGQTNGGTITASAVSSALALAPAWSSQELRVGSLDADGGGDIALNYLAGFRGTLTDAQLIRRLSSLGVS